MPIYNACCIPLLSIRRSTCFFWHHLLYSEIVSMFTAIHEENKRNECLFSCKYIIQHPLIYIIKSVSQLKCFYLYLHAMYFTQIHNIHVCYALPSVSVLIRVNDRALASLRYLTLHYVMYVICCATLWELRYAVKRYATLWDVTLRCETLRYVVRCYATLCDVTLRFKMLRYAVRRYATL